MCTYEAGSLEGLPHHVTDIPEQLLATGLWVGGSAGVVD